MRIKYFKLIILLIPAFPLLINLDRVAFHPGSIYSDLLISHLPNTLFLKQAILVDHVVPLWSPYILSGFPFGANPLSGLYYLPGWLALLLPITLSFNLLVIFHIFWGGAGLYLNLKSIGLGEYPALFGAVIFGGMPKLFAHLGVGHITLLYAISWTPWLLLVDRVTEKDQRIPRFFLPGVVLSIIFLADVRWAVYSGLVWLAYIGWNILTRNDQTIRKWFNGITRAATNIFTCICLSSPLLLPLIEFTNLSTRNSMSGEENLFNSLPPAQLLGLIYPYIRGPAEWILYPGAITLILFFVGLFQSLHTKKISFWYLVAFTTLILAMGSYLPFGDLLANLPILGLLRVPPRGIFLTHLAFSIIAANVFSRMLSAPSQNLPQLLLSKRQLSCLLIFGMFSLLFGLAVAFFIDQFYIRLQFIWGGVCVFLSVVSITLIIYQKLPWRSAAFVIFFLAIVDLSFINFLNLEFRAQNEVLNDRSDVAQFIKDLGGNQQFRVYSPSYSIPQHVSMAHELELADGVDPLILQNYQRYMEKATGVTSIGYSVTLPPFSEDPSTDNREAIPDAGLLGLINVKYVISDFEMAVKDLVFVDKVGSAWVYENASFLPRAWVQSPTSKIGQEITPVDVVRINPNHVKLFATGPGLLVLSEIMYPGWTVTVDGIAYEIQMVSGLFRGVVLDPGTHEVEFKFKPQTVTTGWIIGGSSLLIVGVLGIISIVEKRREYSKR